MTVPTVGHWDVGDKYEHSVTKIKKIRGRENTFTGTWNVRNLRPAGKLEELIHGMNMYRSQCDTWEKRRRKKPWITKDVLDLCDETRDLKKKRYEAERAKAYRETNKRIQKAVKKVKEDWIGAQCEEMETYRNKNNSKIAYQLVKDLTSEKQG